MHALSSALFFEEKRRLKYLVIVCAKPVDWQRALFGNCEILYLPHPNLLPEGEEISLSF